MSDHRCARVWPTVVLLTAFCLWTVLLGAGTWRNLDAEGLLAPPDEMSPSGQIAGAFALLTMPGFQFLTLVAVAIWAYRRRLRHLSITVLAAGMASWLASSAVKAVVARPRPPTAADLISSSGWSYPSSHMTAAAAVSTIAIVTAVATRQPRRVRRYVSIGAATAVVIIAINRIVLQAHYISDLVGGALLGAAVSSGVVAISGVKTEFFPRRRPDTKRRRCAIIVNPIKVEDWATLRRHVSYEADLTGWRVLWLETTEEESATSLVAQAVESNASLIITAGGDGTVREISSAMVNSGVDMAILPLGTGNLLARNLGIPLDIPEAIKVAFGNHDRTIDLVRLTADNREPEHFAVMAGIGIDAALMNATNTDLKRIVGPAAYFLAAPHVLNAPPFDCLISIDENRELSTSAAIALIGNVGSVMGQIQLLPDAKPDDGVLDLVVASPQKVTDWARIAGRVISGSDDPAELARASGRTVTIEIDGDPVDYQLDGDTVGSCSRLHAEIVPRALTVRIPEHR